MNQTKLNRKTLAADGGDFAALIGLDWASQEHALSLYDCATAKKENSTLEHTPEAIARWAQGLAQRRTVQLFGVFGLFSFRRANPAAVTRTRD